MSLRIQDEQGFVSTLYSGNGTPRYIKLGPPEALILKKMGGDWQIYLHKEDITRYIAALKTHDTIYTSAFENTFPSTVATLKSTYPEYFI